MVGSPCNLEIKKSLGWFSRFGSDLSSTPRHLDTSAVLPLASPPRRKAWPHTRAQRWREQVPAHRAVEVCWMVGHPTPLKVIETSCVSSRGSTARACTPTARHDQRSPCGRGVWMVGPPDLASCEGDTQAASRREAGRHAHAHRRR
eukprot:scaffold61218_cov56-Phaeocystis_antarctica.AAC.1